MITVNHALGNQHTWLNVQRKQRKPKNDQFQATRSGLALSERRRVRRNPAQPQRLNIFDYLASRTLRSAGCRVFAPPTKGAPRSRKRPRNRVSASVSTHHITSTSTARRST